MLFAIRKLESVIDGNRKGEDQYKALTELKFPSKNNIRILISDKDSYNFITSDKIAWFESEDKCIFIVTNEGKKAMTTFATINEIEELLPQEYFFRVSRSHLVNISAIKAVKKSFNYKLTVIVEAGNAKENISVSVAKKKEFLSWFGHGKL